MSARFSLSLFGLPGLLLLAACNAGDPPANQAPNQAAEPAKGNLTAAATPPPRAAGKSNAQEPAQAKLEDLDSANASVPAARNPTAVTRSWFTGRWTDTGDCADAATFASNGTYVLADGTRGMWNVQDSRLVIQNSGGRNVVRVRRVGDDAVETVAADGTAGRSTRC